MRGVRAGLMRHRVEIQAPAESLNSTGETIEDWRTETVRWAEVVPVSSRELLQAEQFEGRVTHKVTMRHWPALTHKHRFWFRDRAFYIDSILDLFERKRIHEVLVVEAV